MKVKIVQKHWTGFSGHLGTTKFENGEADVTPQEAKRIGANIQIVEVEESGEEGRIVSITAEMVRTRSLSAEVIPIRERANEADPAPQPTKAEDATDPAPQPTKAEDATDPAPQPTKAEDATDPAPQPTKAEDATDPAPQPTKAEDATDPAPQPTKAEDATGTPAKQVKHTRESLEAIADAKGIMGLREIGDPMNAKAKSIPLLIENILKAQDAPAA